jgi:beta-glucosidase
MFCTRHGAIHSAHTGDVACDHYRRYREDVALMQQIGLKAYRFSIAWPRVLPEGVGMTSAAGLAFYDRLVDALLEAKIEPWVTLFHWDFPQDLFCRGGWLARDSAEWFAEYTGVVADRLSDRVTKWITLNEPQVYIGLGHGDAIHAPGLKLTFAERLLATHHTLMAHGRAVQVLRARCKKPAQIGWAPVGRVEVPTEETPANMDAARRSTLSCTKRDSWSNTWYADPVCLGHYPEDGLEFFGEDAPRPEPGDMELIRQPMDFFGLNTYTAARVRAGADGEPVTVPHAPGFAQNTLKWAIVPEALYWGPRFIWERYRLPIVITENGMCNLDWVDADGRVRDPQRIDYTRRHLQNLARAIAEGVDVRGYFHWSIMDNFEWAEGYKERFGLIHVDYATQKRTLKESAHWYRDVIASGGQSLGAAPDASIHTTHTARGSTLRSSKP